MGWLYWRKLMGGDFSDGELAWTSKQMALREFTKCPKGIDKTHPCEKPIELIVWCMGVLGIPEGATVFDPFMGSGTTGVACVRTGRNFIGCEIDASYFAIAQRRIAKAQLQPPLFPHEPQAKHEQLALDQP
jgi:DNA modification methylase